MELKMLYTILLYFQSNFAADVWVTEKQQEVRKYKSPPSGIHKNIKKQYNKQKKEKSQRDMNKS